VVEVEVFNNVKMGQQRVYWHHLYSFTVVYGNCLRMWITDVRLFYSLFSETIDNSVPCGGGLEYLHHSHVNRRRRWKGNPVPGGITGPLCYWWDINTGTRSSRWVGCRADALAQKKNYCEIQRSENLMQTGRIF
jgi:hypothetical protein